MWNERFTEKDEAWYLGTHRSRARRRARGRDAYGVQNLTAVSPKSAGETRDEEPSRDVTMNFVDALLARHHRRESAQATVKSKLRGRRVLLESVSTVAPGELVKGRRSSAAPGATRALASAGVSRAARRKVMLAAASEVSYEQQLQQHSHWVTYAADALQSAKDAEAAIDLMANVDWHGAHMCVVSSASPSHEHAAGLVLAETRRMLLLLSERRRVWVPKRGTIVEVQLPPGTRAGEVVRLEADKHVM